MQVIFENLSCTSPSANNPRHTWQEHVFYQRLWDFCPYSLCHCRCAGIPHCEDRLNAQSKIKTFWISVCLSVHMHCDSNYIGFLLDIKIIVFIFVCLFLFIFSTYFTLIFLFRKLHFSFSLFDRSLFFQSLLILQQVSYISNDDLAHKSW